METSDQFFDRPILNSPYEYPVRHWELDQSGQPTNRILDRRRQVSFITPIPKPKKGKAAQGHRHWGSTRRHSESRPRTSNMSWRRRSTASATRSDRWRALTDLGEWRVTPETARLLHHWRHHRFNDIRPFFCQVEAVETVIWLTEVAPNLGSGRQFLEHLGQANDEANPDLSRLALKLATGAGKTTVMAMIIAWQTINAVRRPNSRRFTRGFLIVTPGITIKDRLRVLQPNDPDSYYRSRELVPGDMLGDLERAKIVITNFHAFKLRETMEVSKGGRALLQGRGPDLRSLESEGQMLQRVMPELLGLRNVLALNDEAHHCYREKPGEDDEGDLKGEDRKEAEKNREGREALDFRAGGGGPPNGPCPRDRSLGDAVLPARLRLCGRHALPVDDERLLAHGRHRVRDRQAAPGAGGRQHPRRATCRSSATCGEHIRKDMPRKGRGKASNLDPPADPRDTANGAGSSLRTLQGDLRAMGQGRHRGPALLHRCLQQHLDLEADLRLHRRIPSREPGRLHDAGERPPGAVPQFR